MRKAEAVIKSARSRNGKAFENWIKRTPHNVPPIDEIRKITAKIPYSMAKEAEDSK